MQSFTQFWCSFLVCSDVRLRIQQKIALAFGISSSSMYLTKPTFFSRINNSEAKTTHDEYWHPHIDKVMRYLNNIFLTILPDIYLWHWCPACISASTLIKESRCSDIILACKYHVCLLGSNPC